MGSGSSKHGGPRRKFLSRKKKNNVERHSISMCSTSSSSSSTGTHTSPDLDGSMTSRTSDGYEHSVSSAEISPDRRDARRGPVGDPETRPSCVFEASRRQYQPAAGADPARRPTSATETATATEHTHMIVMDEEISKEYDKDFVHILDFFHQSRYVEALEEAEKIANDARTAGETLKEFFAEWVLSEGHYFTANFEASRDHGLKALKLAEEIGKGPYIAIMYSALCGVYDRLSDTHNMQECAEKLEELAKQLQTRRLRHRFKKCAWHHLANCALSKCDYRKALYFNEKCLRIAIKTNDRVGEGLQYGSIGNVYCAWMDYHKAVQYYEKEIEMAQETLRSVRGLTDDSQAEETEVGGNQMLSIPYTNAASAYMKLGQLQKTKEYYKKALAISLRNGDKFIQGRIYTCLGDVARKEKRYEDAVKHYSKGKDVAVSLKDKEGECLAWGSIGRLHAKELRNYEEAVKCFERCYQIAEKNGYKREQMLAAQRLAHLLKRHSDGTESSIEKRQYFKERRRSLSKEVKQICSICLKSIGWQQDNVQALLCGHVYHEKCIEEWVRVKATCPECRKPVQEVIYVSEEYLEHPESTSVGIQ